jgi:hypothetical protein
MSITTRSMWPQDLPVQDSRTPFEILSEQAGLLAEETGGTLTGHVHQATLGERRILAFEVAIPSASMKALLFEVQQSPIMEYPAAIIPPAIDLPEFLRRKIYRPSPNESWHPTPADGEWESNNWVADSPWDFEQKLRRLLSSGEVKSVLFNLVARSKSASRSTNGDESR